MSILTIALTVAALLSYLFYRRRKSISIKYIPGPSAASFLLGNLPEYLQGQAGEADFKWQSEYGDVVRIKAAFGEDRLLISDPKALQYIYQSGYNFRKHRVRREMARLVAGRGLAWADGEDHKRQRRIITPSLGAPEVKPLLPLFSYYASKLTSKWRNMLIDVDGSAVFDVTPSLSRAALDVIGEAAFDYQFAATDNDDNALAKAAHNLIELTLGSPSNAAILMQSLFDYMPTWLLQAFLDYAPVSTFKHARKTTELALGVARDLVRSKSEALLQGKGKRDVMSLLVKANNSQDRTKSMSEIEMLSQMETIMQAGHDTTASTLSWSLYELARHPEVQSKVRSEIRAVEKIIHDRGDIEFTVADFESMTYTLAVMKEVLRFHPVTYSGFRIASKDLVLPLSKPIASTTGTVITEIPILKGTTMYTSICGYNRNMELFGEDSHSFRPERWLDGTVKHGDASIGVYNNLMTFGSGLRSCIGWRLAVLELQAFMVELVSSFEFALTSDRIRRESCLVMVPTVAGQGGKQLPLRVSLISNS